MNAAEAGAGLFPTKRITADKQPMLERAASAPETRWRAWARGCPAPLRAPRLQRSLCHPAVIGRRIEVTADLARVRVACDGQAVADHQRLWAWHQSITDPAHRAAAQALRHQRAAVLRRPTEPQVQVRALADYDAAFGIDGGVA